MQHSKLKIVRSPTCPGDGWIEVSEEFAKQWIEFDEECIRDFAKFEALIKSCRLY